MALKILAPLPPAPEPVKRREPAVTKYGQDACSICLREPPIAPTGICAMCAAKLNSPTK